MTSAQGLPLAQEIPHEALSEVPKKPLYHYTTQKGLLGIVKSREIWATHHQYLNDVKEFVHAKELFHEELTKTAQADPILEGMCSAMKGEGFENVNLYVTSFSEDPDSLAQWRAYGEGTSGFSLGFDIGATVIPNRFTVTRCIYDEASQRAIIGRVIGKVLSRLRRLPFEIIETPQFAKPYLYLFPRVALHSFALIFKDRKFCEEREWRIMSSEPLMDDVPGDRSETPLDFREGKSTLIPYRRIPLRNTAGIFPLLDMVIGPTPYPEQAQRSVHSFLTNQGFDGCKPRKSDVPFRNW